MPAADVTLEAILAARRRIAGLVRATPVLTNPLIDADCGARLHFKCENLQEMGAFKTRGASNAIFIRPEAALRAGVVTHSSGNHGAAVARAARQRGVPARIVMPHNSSAAKFAAVLAYGGEIIRCEPTVAAREREAARIVAETGALFVHPYDDPDVIAGQGTVAVEMLEEVPQLQWVLCPIGGGGLTSGIAVAIKSLRPDVQVVAVEPAGADDAWRSWTAGKLQPPAPATTIADGLRGALSPRTFALVREHVDRIVTVGEEAIIAAMRELWQRLRLVVEPSSAVAFAAVREGLLPVAGADIGVVLTGGNVDLDSLPW